MPRNLDPGDRNRSYDAELAPLMALNRDVMGEEQYWNPPGSLNAQLVSFRPIPQMPVEPTITYSAEQAALRGKPVWVHTEGIASDVPDMYGKQPLATLDASKYAGTMDPEEIPPFVTEFVTTQLRHFPGYPQERLDPAARDPEIDYMTFRAATDGIADHIRQTRGGSGTQV